MNWIDFVKSYSAKHNIKYSHCLKDPKCKEEYHAQKNNNNKTKMEHPAAPSVDSEESFILSPPLNNTKTKSKLLKTIR